MFHIYKTNNNKKQEESCVFRLVVIMIVMENKYAFRFQKQKYTF
jgi:hypothetical protein